MIRLNDEDHHVNAILQLGGVRRELKDIRGTLIERFLIGEEDVTQSVTRLERAGLVDKRGMKWSHSREVIEIVAKKIDAGILRVRKP